MEKEKIEETVNQLAQIKKDKKKQRQKMPKEVAQNIFKKVFHQLLAAICIMLYFVVLNLAYTNMKEERLIGDIEVFAGAFLVVGIVMLERAYKHERGTYAIAGIELLLLSLHTLSIMHVITMFKYDFRLYLLTSSYIFSIYYVLKSIIIYLRERKIYLKGLSDIPEIIKKEEPSKKEATKRNVEEEIVDKKENSNKQTKKTSKNKNTNIEMKKKKAETQAKKKTTSKQGEKETSNRKTTTKKEEKQNKEVMVKEKSAKETITKKTSTKKTIAKKETPKKVATKSTTAKKEDNKETTKKSTSRKTQKTIKKEGNIND